MTAAEQTLELLTPSLTPALHLTDTGWRDTVFDRIRAIPAGHRFQAFDLVAAGCPDPPDVAHGWGAALSAAAKASLVRCVGAEPSRRPSVRGSLTRLWERLP